MQYSFIWDMDGTLADSYPALVPAVQKVCAEYGLNVSPEYVYSQVIGTSVGDFLTKSGKEIGIDPAILIGKFNILNDSCIDAIRAVRHAGEALSGLRQAGHQHFVYTHRGASCVPILKHTGLYPYFTEIVTASEGFPRKPAPDAILYLIKKYGLSPSGCFYVGDRRVDVEAACNAGIGSILYLDPSSPGKPCGMETHIVTDLLDIRQIVLGPDPMYKV